MQNRRGRKPKLGEQNLSAEIRKRKRKLKKGKGLGRSWQRHEQVERMAKESWGRKAKCFWRKYKDWSVSELGFCFMIL